MERKIMTTKIAIFKGKKIRKIIYKNEWWFSIIDIVEVLTGTERPRKYWNDLKKKLINEGYIELSENIGQLKLLAKDSKKYLTDCANTETIMLDERATTEITRTEDSKGIPNLKKDAQEGGDIAGGAKKKLEKRLGKPISSKENYLEKPQDRKLLG